MGRRLASGRRWDGPARLCNGAMLVPKVRGIHARIFEARANVALFLRKGETFFPKAADQSQHRTLDINFARPCCAEVYIE
eukprot:5423093-Pyramimonas_sp.AAC.1